MYEDILFSVCMVLLGLMCFLLSVFKRKADILDAGLEAREKFVELLVLGGSVS